MTQIRWLSISALILGAACSLFKARVEPYPSGVSFPLAEQSSVAYPGKIIPPLRHRDGIVYFAVQKGHVFAVDLALGRISWEFKTENPVQKELLLGPEKIYVLDEGDILYVLDLKGGLVSKTALGEKISTGIVEDGARLYLGAEAGDILALDALDPRKIVWRTRTGSAVREDPVFRRSEMAVGTEDRRVHFIDIRGKVLGTFELSGRPQGPALAAEGGLFLGTDDRFFRRLAWRTGKEKWKIRLGGVVVAIREAGGGRLLLLGSNGVLYCLDSGGGDILWWRNIPARRFFGLEMSDGKVLVSSLSNRLPAFDLKTGNPSGEHLGVREFASNALWIEPIVVQSVYDFSSDAGKIVLLKKALQVSLAPSLPSPQPAGREILFQASQAGFHLPHFEFYIKDGSKTDILQKKSEKTSWTWFPDKEGTFTVGVRAADEKAEKEAELTFVILKPAENK